MRVDLKRYHVFAAPEGARIRRLISRVEPLAWVPVLGQEGVQAAAIYVAQYMQLRPAQMFESIYVYSCIETIITEWQLEVLPGAVRFVQQRGAGSQPALVPKVYAVYVHQEYSYVPAPSIWGINRFGQRIQPSKVAQKPPREWERVEAWTSREAACIGARRSLRFRVASAWVQVQEPETGLVLSTLVSPHAFVEYDIASPDEIESCYLLGGDPSKTPRTLQAAALHPRAPFLLAQEWLEHLSPPSGWERAVSLGAEEWEGWAWRTTHKDHGPVTVLLACWASHPTQEWGALALSWLPGHPEHVPRADGEDLLEVPLPENVLWARSPEPRRLVQLLVTQAALWVSCDAPTLATPDSV